MNGGWGISYEIALRWMPLDLTDGKSTLVQELQVMAWCRQATSHYFLSQCWPRSLSPYDVTRPQWVNRQWNCWSLRCSWCIACKSIANALELLQSCTKPSIFCCLHLGKMFEGVYNEFLFPLQRMPTSSRPGLMGKLLSWTFWTRLDR